MESNLSPEESGMLVYFWLKLFGLAPVSLKNNKFYPASILGKLYSIVASVMYGLAIPSAYFMTSGRAKKISSHIISKNDAIAAMHVIVSCVTLAAIPIFLLSISKKVVYLLNDLRATSKDLRNLGIVDNQGKFLKNLFVSTVKMNSLIGTTHMIIQLTQPDRLLLVAIIVIIKDLAIAGTILIFSQILILVRQCFELLNSELCNGIEDPRAGNRARNVTRANLERIEKLGALHFKLCDFVERTSQLFSAPILMCILLCFTIFMLFSCQMLPGIMHPGQLTSMDDYLAFIREKITSSVLTVTMTTTGLVFLLQTCVTTCRQGNAAKVTLFKTWNKFHLAELKDEFGIFSLQMMYKPVTVSAFGFFHLDYTCLLKILGAVIVYSTVVAQANY